MAKKAQLRGLTLMELTIGLVVLAMVLGALAALMGAIGKSWQGSGQMQTVQISSRQATASLESILRESKWVGLATGPGTSPTSATIMVWSGDDNADGKMQTSEISLIEHDAAAGTLVLWQVPDTAPGATVQCTQADINDAADIAKLKSVGGVTSTVIARNVAAARFGAYMTAGDTPWPVVEYILTFSAAGQSRTQYGSVSLRSPAATQP